VKILALMPDPYRGFGGIAQYNRDLLDALIASSRVERIVSLTRHYPDPESGYAPPPPKLEQHFLPGNPIRYAIIALEQAVRLRPDAVLCGHMNLVFVAAAIKLIMRSRLLMEAYGIECWDRLRGLRGWGIEKVDLVIAISRYTRERLIGWSGLDPDRVRLVPNAVHLAKYSMAPKPDYLVSRYGLERKLVLLTVGRLPGNERYKGQDRIISLIPNLRARFSNLVYLIVGDGADRKRLEALVSRLGVEEYVVFAGRIPESEKIDHYNLADAFAMPSDSEGFGFVFLEAAACGLPVLGGSTDGSRDALVDGRLGVMVDPDSPEELLGGLEEILTRSKKVPDCLQPFGFARFEAQIEQLIASV
jgi:phosphatidylinositol alpha-1,6-mannosyltransferase